MRIIWKNGGTALYSHIMEELGKDSNVWKKNTVLTLLSRLVEKNYLKTDKIGRRNEYRAVVGEQEYRAKQTRNFLDKIYQGNVSGLVSTLLQQEILSEEELKEIEAFWERRRQE